ncbi:MAG: hypothetical protein LBS96_10380 [Oscillospiraceae bacterium]|nr:hypothetical protein [Oscillospiraceae bacterium]
MKRRRKINRGAVLMLALAVLLIGSLTGLGIAHKAAKPILQRELEAVMEAHTALLLLPEDYRNTEAAEVPEAVLAESAATADEALRPYFAATGKTYETTLRRLREQLQAQADGSARRLFSLKRSLTSVDYSFEPGMVTVNFFYTDTVAYADAPAQTSRFDMLSGNATFRKEGGAWKLLYLSLSAPNGNGSFNIVQFMN